MESEENKAVCVWEERMLLHKRLPIPSDIRCICAVGAGGKTGLLYGLAESYRSAGRKTLLITTTKMYQPADGGMLDRTADEILAFLEEKGFAVAGTTISGGKMGPLPPEILEPVMEKADLVLVEADGSRRLPLKVPERGEPVLLPACDFLIVVEGMSAVGQPLGQVCHRAERAMKILGFSDPKGKTQNVTVEMAAKLSREGYGRYFETRKGFFFMNQTDCLTWEQIGRLEKEMRGTNTVLGSLKTGKFCLIGGAGNKEKTEI